MKTANPKAGFGAVRHYQSGGLISSMKNMLGMKTETISEKYARQDAERAAKKAPVQVPVQPEQKAISQYAGMTALQQREKAAGLKAGGMVKKKCVEGGKIEGPGGPREDLIPIMASNGEFMIKASSAKILGPELLEALNEVGDDPKSKDDDAKEDAKEGKKMAIGGSVQPPMNTTPITEQDQQAFNNLQSTPTAITQDAQTQETGFSDEAKANGRSMLNSFTPMAVPQLEMKTGGMVRRMNKGGKVSGIDELVTGTNGTVQMRPTANQAVATQPVSPAQAPSMERSPVDLHNEKLANAKAQQAASLGATKYNYSPEREQAYLKALNEANALKPLFLPTPANSRQAAANANKTADDALNQIYQGSPSSPATTQSPVEKAYADPSRKLDVNYGAGSAPAPAPAPATPNPELNDPTSNASILARNPGGAIRKVVQPNGTVSYSGGNVTGAEAGFVGADGKPISGGPGGGFMVVQGRSKDEIDRTLTNPDGSRWSAADNQIMAANIRDGVHKYLGTSRDPRNAPQRTKAGHAAAVQREQIAMQNKRYGEQNAIAQEQLGMSRTEHVAKMDAQKQLADAQAAYLNAPEGSPEQKLAERKLMALGGKQPAAVRQMVVPGGQGFNADGTTYTLPSSVYDPDTKQFIQQPQGQGAKPAQNYDAWKAKLLAHPSNKGQPVPSEQQLQAEYAKQFPKG